jgi:hypothetical protein
MRLRLIAQLALLLAVAFVAAFASARSTEAGFEGLVIGGGQLDTILVSNDLSCQVFHQGEENPAIWPLFIGDADCGTFVYVNGQLYGPKFSDQTTAVANLPASYIRYTPVSQQFINDDQVETVVALGDSGLQVVQYDWVGDGSGAVAATDESWQTAIFLVNNTGSPVDASILRGVDCVFSTFKYGFSDGVYNGAAGCSTTLGNSPSSELLQIIPTSPNYSYEVSAYQQFWFTLGTFGLLGSICNCGAELDVAAGLQWYVTAPAGGIASAWLKTTYATTGARPVRLEISASDLSPEVLGTTTYTLTLHNPNPYPVTISEIDAEFDFGMEYAPGTTSGLTEVEPDGGFFVTWAGPFVLPANSSSQLHFGGRVIDQDFNRQVMQVTAYGGDGQYYQFWEGAPVTPDPLRLFEGWGEVSFWLGDDINGVPFIIDGLENAIEPNTWETIAHYDGANWQQTFRSAPLPSFNTLTAVAFGLEYWIFANAEAELVFPQ